MTVEVCPPTLNQKNVDIPVSREFTSSHKLGYLKESIIRHDDECA